MVEDRGKGFDLQTAMRRSAIAGEDGFFGLFSIRERLSLIGGLLSIKSHPGAGTHVEIELHQREETAGVGRAEGDA